MPLGWDRARRADPAHRDTAPLGRVTDLVAEVQPALLTPVVQLV
jgi:hypothetical protein